MTRYITYVIVPALTDQAGQCRIQACEHGDGPRPTLRDYRQAPSAWKEAGLMNSRGEIVCLEKTGPSHPSHYNFMKRDEPLMAGTTYTFVAGTDQEV